jgi:hypothetical protein
MSLLLAQLRKAFNLSLCCLIVSLAFSDKAHAQIPVPCNEITGKMGFTVRSVKIKGRWVPQKLQERVETIVGVGGRFSPTVVNPAIVEVRKALTEGENDLAQNDLSRGASSILYIIGDACDVSDDANPKQVEIIIRPYYVRVDLLNVGNNVLPIPHVNSPTQPFPFWVLPMIAITGSHLIYKLKLTCSIFLLSILKIKGTSQPISICFFMPVAL